MNLRRILVLAGSLGFVISAAPARADLARCQATKDKATKLCGRAFQILKGGGSADADAAGAGDDAGDAGGSLTGGGDQLMSQANADAAVWGQVPGFCAKLKRQCADACTGLEPEEQATATQVKYDCFGDVEQKVSEANRNVASLRQASAGAAASTNESLAQGENVRGAPGDQATVQQAGLQAQCAYGYVWSDYWNQCVTPIGAKSPINRNTVTK